MFSRKIPFYYFVVCILVTAAATWFIVGKANKVPAAQIAASQSQSDAPSDCEFDITRLSGYKYISPLVSAAQECEAKRLAPLKLNIMDYIDYEQKAGNLQEASVYLRVLFNDDWININPKATFHPASLLKVPQLITYLRMAEKDPGLLNKKYLFVKHGEEYPVQYYSAKTLQPGHTYSIKELFHFMIAYSDNYANMELIKHMDMEMFKKTFTDLKLVAPDMTDQNYQMSSKDYSKFLEALYNAAYLNIEASEYASELLTEASFKDGIVKKIPSTIKVAHKMGEWGDGSSIELHDCGIVYLNNNPYLMTIMTRGRDMAKLSETVSNISKMAYDAMVAENL
jgi:beta-lactamase class A